MPYFENMDIILLEFLSLWCHPSQDGHEGNSFFQKREFFPDLLCSVSVMAGQPNDYGKRSHNQSEFSGNGGKKRNPNEEKQRHVIGAADTVYRYLYPARKIGSIIGKGGEIAKQLRSESRSNIRIGDCLPGCEERIVTIYSSSEETNLVEDTDIFISPAQDALFKVHDRIVADEFAIDEDIEEPHNITVRMLVPDDQIGCVIGKGGQVVQSIRSDTGAQIRILRDDHMPLCALSSDELIQIIGDASVVRKALYQVASRLHDYPSRSQHLLLTSTANMHHSGGEWPRSSYPARLDEASAREFSLCLVCPTENIGGVIGKSGIIINQIRQESGASIKVDSSNTEGDDCRIYVSAKEYVENPSPTIDAALRLQPRCSEKSERESGDSVITTRLLVPSSRIGCLIGKGGSVISEMRSSTRATIRIISDENLPNIASEDEEMVQISGDLKAACSALSRIALRLKANHFEKGGVPSTYPPVLACLPSSLEILDSPKYGNWDGRRRGYSSHSPGFRSSDFPATDTYRGHGGSMSGSRGSYGVYGAYISGRSGDVGLSTPSPFSTQKHYGY